jgi:hypothetical protein
MGTCPEWIGYGSSDWPWETWLAMGRVWGHHFALRLPMGHPILILVITCIWVACVIWAHADIVVISHKIYHALYFICLRNSKIWLISFLLSIVGPPLLPCYIPRKMVMAQLIQPPSPKESSLIDEKKWKSVNVGLLRSFLITSVWKLQKTARSHGNSTTSLCQHDWSWSNAINRCSEEPFRSVLHTWAGRNWILINCEKLSWPKMGPNR